MSENKMVASTSSRSASADGEASTRSATSGGRKEARCPGEQGALLHALEAETESGLRGQVGDQLLAGGGERLPRRDGHSQRPQQLVFMFDRERPTARLRLQYRLFQVAAVERDWPGKRAGGPTGLRLQQLAEPQPHDHHLRARRLDDQPCHLLQGVIGGGPGHASRKLRKDLVGAGSLAVDEAVGEPSTAFADRLEGDCNHSRGDDREEQILISAGANKRAYPDDDRQVHHGDEHSEQAIDQGPANQQVNVVQSVTQDGDADSDRDAKPPNGGESGTGKVEQE